MQLQSGTLLQEGKYKIEKHWDRVDSESPI